MEGRLYAACEVSKERREVHCLSPDTASITVHTGRLPTALFLMVPTCWWWSSSLVGERWLLEGSGKTEGGREGGSVWTDRKQERKTVGLAARSLSLSEFVSLRVHVTFPSLLCVFYIHTLRQTEHSTDYTTLDHNGSVTM